MKTCSKCNTEKPVAQFHRHKECKLGYNPVCKTCRRKVAVKRYKATAKEYQLLSHAKERAKLKGLIFDLEISDIVIPSVCPVLGKRIKAKTEYAASLDRFIPSLGYTKENVRVISKRANM